MTEEDQIEFRRLARGFFDLLMAGIWRGIPLLQRNINAPRDRVQVKQLNRDHFLIETVYGPKNRVSIVFDEIHGTISINKTLENGTSTDEILQIEYGREGILGIGTFKDDFNVLARHILEPIAASLFR